MVGLVVYSLVLGPFTARDVDTIRFFKMSTNGPENTLWDYSAISHVNTFSKSTM